MQGELHYTTVQKQVIYYIYLTPFLLTYLFFLPVTCVGPNGLGDIKLKMIISSDIMCKRNGLKETCCHK